METHYVVAPKDEWRCMVVFSEHGEIRKVAVLVKDVEQINQLVNFPMQAKTIGDLEAQLPEGYKLVVDLPEPQR